MKKIAKVFGLILFGLLAILCILIIIFYKADIPATENHEKYFTAESRYVEIDSNKIHVREIGEGFPVLLIHGSFSSLYTWEKWQIEMKNNFKTISVDLPGHGLTGPNPKGLYHTDYNADILWKLINKLNYDTIAIAGNSMGGQVAYKMAIKHPERVKKLILINSSGARNKADIANSKGQNSFSVFSLINHPIFSQLMTSLTPRYLFEMSLKQVYFDQKKITDQKIQMYYDLILHEGNREATLKRFGQKTPTKFHELSNIKIPSLIMWGKHDSWIPVAHAFRFDSAITKSSTKIYEEAGHVPMEEIPVQTAKDAIDFLKN